MFWLILTIIICMINIIKIFLDSWSSVGEKFAFSFLTVLVGALCFVLCLCTTSALVTSEKNTIYECSNTQPIVAVQDNITGEGRSFLFSGYYEEELSYFYCIKDNLGYKVEQVNIDDSYVKYTDKDYRIETYEPKFTNKVVEFFCGAPLWNNRYILYCPEGTVIKEYNIDLQ